MKNSGRARSSIYLHMSPDPKSKIIEVLNPGDSLEIHEDAGNMFKVESTRLSPAIPGYTLKSGVVINKNEPRLQIFKKINLMDGDEIDAVPPSLLAAEFDAWIGAKGEPTWLLENGDWTQKAGDQIRAEFQPYQEAWAKWFADVAANHRAQFSNMKEWFTVLNGGESMWSFRAERIFQNPTERSAGLGWATPKDILHWTGRTFFAEKERKYKHWHEVQLTKQDREIQGWYKANLLEEFSAPEVFIDPYDSMEADSVFDLTQPVLRIPVDPEIDEAQQAGRHAYQYINVKNAIGRDYVNKNLCGQFCIAALIGVDVIPLLKRWYSSGERAKTVLEKDKGTVIYDLQDMLDLFDRKSEMFTTEPGIAPATPGYLKKMLMSGKKAVLGMGVSTIDGRVAYHGRVRHWVVLEDVVRMGNSGWVRLYNPYFNRDEVYPHHVVFDLKSSTIGLWVDDDAVVG